MPLTEKFAKAFRQHITNNSDPCRRCGYFHNTRACKANFKDCYQKGMSLLEGNDKGEGNATTAELRDLAETIWQTETKKVTVKKTPKGGRTPLPEPNLGKPFLQQQPALLPGTQPTVSPNGSCRFETELVGPEPKKNQIHVVSNYVKVTAVPQELFVYSLSFWRPNPDKTKPNLPYNKKREIKLAFDSVIASDDLELRKNRHVWATDYKDLWTHKALGNHFEGREWNVGPFEYKQLNGKLVKDLHVTIHHTGRLQDIQRSLENEDINDLSDHIRALNAHVARAARQYSAEHDKKTIQVGANKFYVENGLREMRSRGTILGMRTMRGYSTSVRPAEIGTLLNINTATGAFIPPMLVSELLDLVGDQAYVEKILKGATVKIAYHRKNFVETQADGIDFNGDLERTKVFVQFGAPADVQKFFKTIEKDRKDPKSVKTTDQNDAGRTVSEFFAKEAKIKGLDAKKNKWEKLCVNVGTRVKSGWSDTSKDTTMREQSLGGAQWIPACLLEIVPNQLTNAMLSTEHTTEMLRDAVRLPAANAGLIIKEGLPMLGLKTPGHKDADEKLDALGFAVGQKLISFAAKSLNLPTLVYAPPRSLDGKKAGPYGNVVEKVPHRDRANWNLENVGFTNPIIEVESLHVLGLPMCFDSLLDRSKNAEEPNVQIEKRLQYCRDDFHEQLAGHDIWVIKGFTEQQKMSSLEKQLEYWFSDCLSNDCTLILLKEKNYDLYSRIKRTAELEYGCYTVCAVGSKLVDRDGGRGDEQKKGTRYQILSNLALKLNMKMGGDNHWLDSASLNRAVGSEARTKTTMICGADVTHPSAGAKFGCPSVACVVGSVDHHFMNYPGSMRLQAGRQEHIEELGAMMKERLRAWSARNDDTLPTDILFYRDGISESQFDKCKDKEIPRIEEVYAELSKELCRKHKNTEQAPKTVHLTFVVVGKRHNTRFYAKEDKYTYMSKQNKVDVVNGNLRPGLLVDSIITNPSPTNFFLQSHCAIQGTARAAHYHVLQDQMELNARLPNLTQMLCYAFGRATTGVSYVAPAYIADRLCEQGRAYLRQWAEQPDAKPVSEAPKDANSRPYSKEDFEVWKKGKALELAQTKSVWGKNYMDDKDLPEEKRRYNPWHSNLDKGMFWM
ncbi:hypothetical protein HBI12_092410 [Parastagonospora nodorum]|nr:hypothetical protein HBI12_092410 [Parastagonospora nodorum]